MDREYINAPKWNELKDAKPGHLTPMSQQDMDKFFNGRLIPGKREVDMVNHPPHYTSHPSGVECIQITEHMGFNLGNALKYIWRADLKNDVMEDLKKAVFYINREIQKRGGTGV